MHVKHVCRGIGRQQFHRFVDGVANTEIGPPCFVAKRLHLLESQLVPEDMVARLPLDEFVADIDRPPAPTIRNEEFAVPHHVRSPLHVQMVFARTNPCDVESDSGRQHTENALKLPVEIVDRVLRSADLARDRLTLPSHLDHLAVILRRQDATNDFHQWNVAVQNVAEPQIDVDGLLIVSRPDLADREIFGEIDSFALEQFLEFTIKKMHGHAFHVDDVFTRFAPDPRHIG